MKFISENTFDSAKQKNKEMPNGSLGLAQPTPTGRQRDPGGFWDSKVRVSGHGLVSAKQLGRAAMTLQSAKTTQPDLYDLARLKTTRQSL